MFALEGRGTCVSGMENGDYIFLRSCWSPGSTSLEELSRCTTELSSGKWRCTEKCVLDQEWEQCLWRCRSTGSVHAQSQRLCALLASLCKHMRWSHLAYFVAKGWMVPLRSTDLNQYLILITRVFYWPKTWWNKCSLRPVFGQRAWLYRGHLPPLCISPSAGKSESLALCWSCLSKPASAGKILHSIT